MTAAVDEELNSLEIQRVSESDHLPSNAFIARCAQAALSEFPDAVVNIRIIDEPEGGELNRQWRNRDQATNVLSFPADLPEGSGPRVLGDIVLCAPVIAREAEAQDKPVNDHWAHLIIHGILHLRGFDHMSPDQAQVMENLEIELLRSLGIPDPYVIDEN